MSAWVQNRMGLDAPNDGSGRARQYLGRSPYEDGLLSGFDSPQAFGVDSYHGTIDVHFHRVPQFTYFLSDGGIFQRRPIKMGNLYFADSFQPYGPTIGAAAGLSYLTLRATADTGANYMPQHRTDLANGLARLERTRRQLDGEINLLEATIELSTWTTFAQQQNGLKTSVCDVAPGAEVPVIIGQGGGAFLLVVHGVITNCGIEYQANSLRWLASHIEIDRVSAGDSGARLALIQFPSDDATATSSAA